MILNPISMFFIGLLLGIVSRLLDIYSDSKKKAMINILPFCIGMLITYYFVAFITKGVYSTSFIIGWTVVCYFFTSTCILCC